MGKPVLPHVLSSTSARPFYSIGLGLQWPETAFVPHQHRGSAQAAPFPSILPHFAGQGPSTRLV